MSKYIDKSFLLCYTIRWLGKAIHHFYSIFPFWDAVLHVISGFMFAAFGFCLVDVFNRHNRFRFELSPLFMALMAFCFSMTIGVLWEFFEYSADTVLRTDMQKDVLKNAINTVSIPNSLGEKVTHLQGIDKVLIHTEGGELIELGGYLDLGITDTMKDLFVNLIGAILFSVIGFFYIKHRGQGHIAKQFIPVVKDQEPMTDETEAQKE